jgi:hypothetical protein
MGWWAAGRGCFPLTVKYGSFLATLGNEIFNLLKFPCNSWKKFVQR